MRKKIEMVKSPVDLKSAVILILTFLSRFFFIFISTVQWYLRNEEISKNDPNMQVLSIGPVGVLKVTPVTNQYYGAYTCEATNRLGMKQFDIELKEAHVPGPVASAKVSVIATPPKSIWLMNGPHSELCMTCLRDVSISDSTCTDFRMDRMLCTV